MIYKHFVPDVLAHIFKYMSCLPYMPGLTLILLLKQVTLQS